MLTLIINYNYHNFLSKYFNSLLYLKQQFQRSSCVILLHKDPYNFSLLNCSPLFATHRLQHATSSLPPPTTAAIPRIAQPASLATAVAIPQSSHSPQLPPTPALRVGPPALLSTLASLATSHPQPHIIPAFSSLPLSLPPPAVTVRSSTGLSAALSATALSLCQLPRATNHPQSSPSRTSVARPDSPWSLHRRPSRPSSLIAMMSY
jgi:hypothetical protein